jgi:hypothetical protein
MGQIKSKTIDMSKYPKISELKHGKWFRATIDGADCYGKISIDSDGDIFLCQNSRSGNSARNKLGFDSSWVIAGKRDGAKTVNYLGVFPGQVSELKVLSRKPAGYEAPRVLPEPIKIGAYELKVQSDKVIKFGCTEVTKEEYLKVGYAMDWIE